jgi:hypothetical protein
MGRKVIFRGATQIADKIGQLKEVRSYSPTSNVLATSKPTFKDFG